MRKCLLLTIAVCCMAVISNAQIKKGSVLLGGNINGSSHKQTYTNSDNDNIQNYLHLSPSLGFVTADNKVWGFSLSTNIHTSKTDGQPAAAHNSAYGGNIFHRRYLTLGKGFYLFGQAGAGYNYIKQKYPASSRTTRTDNVYISAYPGISYAISKNFHLEAGLNELASLSYSAQNEVTISGGAASSVKTKYFSFNTNISNSNPLTLGFRFVL